MGRLIGGRYRLISRLASGAMGVVYRAERVGLGRPVAVKFLLEPYADEPSYRAAFEREAEAMSRLSHPHCVPAIDYGVEEAPYLVMDLVAGVALDKLLDLGPLPWERAVRIQLQLLAGLAHAHGRQIVHRDIKPANIMLAEVTAVGDHVRVLDFGIARLCEGAATVEPSLPGSVAGTPPYMAPEQWRAEPLDSRTDVYAAGVVLYEMLAGRPPFVGSNFVELMEAHLGLPPPPLAELNPWQRVPKAVEAVVLRALQKDPNDRFPSAQAFHDALSEQLDASRAPTVPVLAAPTPVLCPVPVAEPARPEEASRPLERSKRADPRSVRWLGALACIAAVAGFSAWPRGADTAPPSAPSQASARRPLLGAAEPGVASIAEQAPSIPGDAPGDHASKAAPPDVREADVHTPPVTSASADSGPSSIEERRALIKRLIATGQDESALEHLQRLRADRPGDARLAYLVGTVYFEKGWWSDAYLHYAEAIRLDRSYRKRSDIVENLIRGLSSETTRSVVSRMLAQDVGKFALPRLRSVAKHDPHPSVRDRAQALYERIQCDGRCNQDGRAKR